MTLDDEMGIPPRPPDERPIDGAVFQVGRPEDHLISREPLELATELTVPERSWPGGPYRTDRPGAGEIVTGIVEEDALEPLEGPEHDDPWVEGWHAGRLDGLADAEIRDRAARRLIQFKRAELLFELAVIVAIVVVFLCTALTIAHTG